MRKIIFRFLFQCKSLLAVAAIHTHSAHRHTHILSVYLGEAFTFQLYLRIPYVFVRFSSSFRTIIPSQFATSRVISSSKTFTWNVWCLQMRLFIHLTTFFQSSLFIFTAILLLLQEKHISCMPLSFTFIQHSTQCDIMSV